MALGGKIFRRGALFLFGPDWVVLQGHLYGDVDHFGVERVGDSFFVQLFDFCFALLVER